MRNYQRSGFGGFSMFPPAVKYLLVANIAVFVLFNIFLGNLMYRGEPLEYFITKLFALQPVFTTVKSPIIGPFMPWQIITYMFMHGGFTHLLFNMLALWMFGIELENLWGTKKFITFYTVCGVGAALSNLFIAPLFSIPYPSVGASGAIFGILVAFGFLFPDRMIFLYFFVPMKAKYFVFLYMGIELFATVTSSQSGIAHAAHLGGGIVGFIYLLVTEKGRINIFKKSSPNSKISDLFGNRPENQKWNPFTSTSTPKPEFNKNDAQDVKYTEVESENSAESHNRRQEELQAKVDAVLDKLGKEGYQNLTEEEKRILFQESKKLR
jgi:membrane associated rhomboid family serine protease